MNPFRMVTGMFTVVLIAQGHILVNKGEHHLSKKIWPISFILGLIA